MGKLWQSVKKYGGKALNVTAKGVQRLDKVGRDNAPAVKRGAKKAGKAGFDIFDKVTSAGQNVNKNIGKGGSQGLTLDLGFGGTSQVRKKKRKTKRKGKRVVIYLKD